MELGEHSATESGERRTEARLTKTEVPDRLHTARTDSHHPVRHTSASKRTPAASALAASAMVARAAAWPSYEPSVWQQCCWHAGSSGRSSGSSSRPQGGVRRGSMERPKCWKYRELQVAVHGLFFCEIGVSPPPNRQKFPACRRNFEGPVGGDAGPQPKIGYPGRHHHPRQSHRRSRRPGLVQREAITDNQYSSSVHYDADGDFSAHPPSQGSSERSTRRHGRTLGSRYVCFSSVDRRGQSSVYV